MGRVALGGATPNQKPSRAMAAFGRGYLVRHRAVLLVECSFS
jgi:hypothetical protein